MTWRTSLLFSLSFFILSNVFGQESNCPSTCEDVAPNVGFETAMNPIDGIYNISVHPDCAGENTYGKSVCGWINAWGSPDIAPADGSSDQHIVFFVQNNTLFNSESIITVDPVEIIPGNTYELEYDYSIAEQPLDELVIALSDGTIPSLSSNISALNYHPLDVVFSASPNLPGSGNHCLGAPAIHRGPIQFTAPADPTLNRILVFGKKASLTGESWVSIDNLEIRLVEGPCDDVVAECPSTCEDVAPNVGFETAAAASSTNFNISVHPQCDGENTYGDAVCGWTAAWGSPDIYPADGSSDQHMVFFIQNNTLINSESIITVDPVEIIPGNTYELEYDYSIAGQMLDELVIALNDGTIPSLLSDISTLSYHPLDVIYAVSPNLPDEAHCMDAPVLHRGPIQFTAPADATLNRILVFGKNGTPTGESWVSLDNLTIRLVEGPCDDVVAECPSTCEDVAPNVGFETATVASSTNFNISVHPQCDGENTYGDAVCGWTAAWGSPDIYPADGSSDQHMVFFIQNNTLINSESIITVDPVEIIPGNTYELEYDYSIAGQMLDELVIALNDGTIPSLLSDISTLSYHPLDVIYAVSPNLPDEAHCMDAPVLHRGPIQFTAPADATLNRILVFGKNGTPTGESWVSLDNLEIRLVEGLCDDVVAECPSSCEDVAPNVGFETAMNPIDGIYNISVHPDCEGENTYGKSVCGWINAWGSPDIAPADGSSDQHIVFFVQNNTLFNSESIITVDPVEVIPGNTYELEYDYSIAEQPLDELVIALSDGTIPPLSSNISALNYHPLDVVFSASPNLPGSGNHCLGAPAIHRGPIQFTAPADPTLNRILVFGKKASLTGESWVSIDNLDIRLVKGSCDTLECPASLEVGAAYQQGGYMRIPIILNAGGPSYSFKAINVQASFSGSLNITETENSYAANLAHLVGANCEISNPPLYLYPSSNEIIFSAGGCCAETPDFTLADGATVFELVFNSINAGNVQLTAGTAFLENGCPESCDLIEDCVVSEGIEVIETCDRPGEVTVSLYHDGELIELYNDPDCCVTWSGVPGIPTYPCPRTWSPDQNYPQIGMPYGTEYTVTITCGGCSVTITDIADCVSPGNQGDGSGDKLQGVIPNQNSNNFFKQEGVESNLNFYPNPTNDLLSLSIPEELISTNLTFKLTNLNGQEIRLTSSEVGNTVTFSVSNIPAGIYFMQVFEENKRVIATQKIIIQH